MLPVLLSARMVSLSAMTALYRDFLSFPSTLGRDSVLFARLSAKDFVSTAIARSRIKMWGWERRWPVSRGGRVLKSRSDWTSSELGVSGTEWLPSSEEDEEVEESRPRGSQLVDLSGISGAGSEGLERRRGDGGSVLGM